MCVIVFDLYLLCVRIGEISHGSNRTCVIQNSLPRYVISCIRTRCTYGNQLNFENRYYFWFFIFVYVFSKKFTLNLLFCISVLSLFWFLVFFFEARFFLIIITRILHTCIFVIFFFTLLNCF